MAHDTLLLQAMWANCYRCSLKKSDGRNSLLGIKKEKISENCQKLAINMNFLWENHSTLRVVCWNQEQITQVALLLWAIWANHSRSFFCKEQRKRKAHGCSLKWAILITPAVSSSCKHYCWKPENPRTQFVFKNNFCNIFFPFKRYSINDCIFKKLTMHQQCKKV